MFDPIAYFQELTETCVLTQSYKFARISSLVSLEEILQNQKKHTHFVAVDDSENGATILGGGNGFWEKRPYTIFLCAAVKFGNMALREQKLAELRAIYRAFLSRIIRDKSQNNLLFFDLSRVPFYEMPGFIGNGCVGIYFMINVDNQINLAYDGDQWDLT